MVRGKNKLPNSKSDDYKVLVLGAAKLASDGKDQNQIADILEIAQPQVSRLLQVARSEDTKWLVDLPPAFQPASDVEHLVRRAENKFFSPDDICNKVNDWAPGDMTCNVKVIYTEAVDETTDLNNWKKSLAELAQGAAEYFINLVRQKTPDSTPEPLAVGVMWGSLIENIVRVFENKILDLPNKEIRFIPLCPEPVHVHHHEQKADRSASILSKRSEIAWNGKQFKDSPSLTGVPAYVPTTFKKDFKKILGFIKSIPGYQDVFGDGSDRTGGQPWVDKIIGCITSVGVFGPWLGTFLDEMIKQEPKLSEDEFSKYVYGDIGGVLLFREDAPSGRLADSIMKMGNGWLGVKRRHLDAIVEKGRDGLGNIVVALEVHKAEMIRAVVRNGLANHLVISQFLKEALLQLD